MQLEKLCFTFHKEHFKFEGCYKSGRYHKKKMVSSTFVRSLTFKMKSCWGSAFKQKRQDWKGFYGTQCMSYLKLEASKTWWGKSMKFQLTLVLIVFTPSIDLSKMVNHGALMAIGWKDLPRQWTKMWYRTTRGSGQGIKTMGQKHWHERAIDKKQKWQGKK